MNAAQTAQWHLMIMAMLVGVLSGAGAVLFYLAIDAVMMLLYGANEATLTSRITSLPWYYVIAAPVLAGLVVGQLLRYTERDRASSIADVIEASVLHDSRVSIRKGLASAAISAISLGGGASTGREGPAVHLSATLSSMFVRAFRLNSTQARTLLGCAVASGVAASFNAPIAGVFFALEVILGHYARSAFAPIVVAAISGTLVSRSFIGDLPVFRVIDHEIASLAEFPAFFILGLASALLAAGFIYSAQVSDKCRPYIDRIPVPLQPAVGGILLGGLGLLMPQVLGVGYEAVTSAINGQYGLSLLIPLIVVKVLASTITMGFRFGGGVFAPSLVLGATLGAAMGLIFAYIAPGYASSEGLYAIVGMGAVASAVLGAPISTVLIIFEITGDYSVTIAVMIASAVASVAVGIFQPRSFFHYQLVRRGLNLEGGRASFLLKSQTVADLMTRDFFTILADSRADKARDLLLAQDGGVLVATEGDGTYAGLISFGDLQDYLAEGQDVRTLMSRPVEPLLDNTPLQEALSLMEARGDEYLPVTSATDDGLIIGILRYRDIIRAYNKALLVASGGE